jgi:hypothetical protein
MARSRRPTQQTADGESWCFWLTMCCWQFYSRNWESFPRTPNRIEEERTRLMLADSVLGCLQIALDPEAIKVIPEPYFPEVLELARQFINKSVRQLEYEEIRRLVQSSMRCWK